MKPSVLTIFTATLPLFPLAAAELAVSESEKKITIRLGDAHILSYHKAEMPPPEGASPLYKRSAFIHPLTAPNGGVLSSIHAKDHFHHMGLWHAWVKTKHKGRELDFWNLKKGQATIRYVKTDAVRKDKSRVGFTVIQHHLALPDEVILKEAFSIDVSLHEKGHYLIDYKTVQENLTDAALELPAYRYGGCIAYRAPLHWNKDNSSYLSSEGKGRDDGHRTRAKWCAMAGPTDKGDAAVTILCHPENRDAPQRQRIWPSGSHNGSIFYNYVPIQEKAWALEPGKASTMRYRIVLSDGRPDKKAADAWFKDYAGE